MRGVTNAAKIANGKSQACSNCIIRKRFIACPPYYQKVCCNAFNEGFKKGAKWAEKQTRNEKGRKL